MNRAFLPPFKNFVTQAKNLRYNSLTKMQRSENVI
jgi:hypothetical protein